MTPETSTVGWDTRSNDAEKVLTALSDLVVRRSVARAGSRVDESGHSDDTDGGIEGLLCELAEIFGARQVCIAEESEDGTTAQVTYDSCRSKTQPGRLEGILSGDFPWLRDHISRGEVVAVPVVGDLPPEAEAERSEPSRRGTASLVALPLVFGPKSFGMAAFEWAQSRPDPPLGRIEAAMVQSLLSTELQTRQAGVGAQQTNRMLRAMVECSDALLRAKDEMALLEEVCRIIVEVGGYRLAWVGSGARDEGRSVTPVAKWGDDEGYLDDLHVTWADIDRGRGPMSRAVRTGLPVAVQSVATDPDFKPWREMALQRGYKSVLAASLDFGGDFFGALGVYAGDAWAFDDVEVEMMQRFADYLGYGIVALRNRAQREDAEKQLRETLRSKDELVASISHELRTPLTAVVGFAQLLREDTELSTEDRAAMIRSIVDEGHDLSNIVEDLLTVAKAEAGTLAVVSVPVDLRAQASQVLESLREEEAARVALVGETRRVWADPGRVRQVLRNLVSNALRYGGDEVVVHIVAGDKPRIQVRDNGPGIPLEDRQRIFESYQKAHHTPGIPGSVGLGLAISRKLARLMDGDLTYDYEQGQSVFELSLPA